MFFSILVVTLVSQLGLTTSCRGGGYYDYNTESPKEDAENSNRLQKFNKMGKFEVPPTVLKEWKDWLKKYKLDAKDKLKKGHGHDEAARGPGKWPSDWANLGPGDAGFPPGEIPPWGYTPQHTGLPGLCYTGPLKGKCEDTNVASVTRWAFNVYIEECVEFEFSGCGGNENNFKDKVKCTEACLNPLPSSCDLETDIPIEDLGIDGRRSLLRKCGKK